MGGIFGAGLASGGTALTLTDGTHTVANVGEIIVSGGVVGGTSPNATLTISGAITTQQHQETPSGLVNGSNTTFTLANTPASAQGVILSFDGITWYYGVDFTVSGNVITTTVAPAIGTTPWAIYNTQSTNGPYVKRVTSYTAVTSVTPNSSASDVIYINYTGASTTITINNDTGAPYESQSILFKFNFTNSQTISWGNIYQGSNLPTSVPGSNAIYWCPMIYDSVYSHWDCSAGLTGPFT